jgi:hypothetical protein
MSKVMTCRCVSEYQDKLYGQSMRVHNPTAKESGWRCTVCDNTNAGEKVVRSTLSGAVSGV